MFAGTIMASSMSCMLVIPFLTQTVYATTDESGKAIRHRDLTIDLGNGIQTDAELTMPVLANRCLF
jgi:hypothetical protein